jgi:membrane protein
VTSPADLTKREWKSALKTTSVEIKQDRVGLISAGVAFYWFLAIFPALIAGIGILDLVDAGAEAISSIEEVVESALPGDAATVIVEALKDTGRPRERASAVAVVTGIALALWSASAGMVALQSGLDVAYDVQKERRFVKKRLYAFLLIAAGGVFGGSAAVLIVGGKAIGTWIETNLVGGPALEVGWTFARWIIGLLLITLLIAVFYYLGPNRTPPRWTWITPGGILTTIGWIAASLGFSFYLSSFGSESYAETYGSFAGVIVLVIWLYLSAFVLLTGAELNVELERRRSRKASHRTRAIPAMLPEAAKGKRSKVGKLLAGVLTIYLAFRKKPSSDRSS